MTLSSQAWQTLSSANQAAWTSYAAGHPIVDALGQSIKLTGSQYFIKCQAALYNVGGPAITMPPVSSVVNPLVPVQLLATSDGFAAVAWQAGTSGDYVAIAVSKYTSLGVNFQKTFHQIGAVDAATDVFDLSAGLAGFAGSPSVGNKVWVRLTPVNSYGLTGTPVIVQVPVVAAGTLPAPVDTSTVAHTLTTTWAVPAAGGILFTFQGPAAIGPWTLQSTNVGAGSPNNQTGFTTGQYGSSIVLDTATGLFTARSSGVVIM